ncbi:MAG: DHH family phosphoesterase [Nanoarchaeota archaeon]|nr:DHH family phosphoesterase [Nanoarchaeota archaeon]
MEKIGDSLKEDIKKKAEKFLEKTKNKEIFLVSHFDTDGITSATIMIQALRKLDRKFTVKILKSLEEKFIRELPKDKVILFLDLASGSLNFIGEEKIEDLFIIDHHEVSEDVPKGVEMVNPWFSEKEKISSSGLVYLFCNEMNPENKKYSKLAVLGMIGDFSEESIGLLGEELYDSGDIQKRKGLMIYPSTRPLNRILEYNSHPFIPGVTGSPEGVRDLLRQSGIEPEKGKYKSIIELNDGEMKNLTTSIMLRSPKTKDKDIIGNIYLLKFFNRVEDAREMSAMINACSRLGSSGAALSFCLEVPEARKKAEEIHAKYKQHLIAGLNLVSKIEKIEGNGFVIINAKDNMMDTIAGTIASILSSSGVYEEGTIIATMAYYENKVKVSTRISGREAKGRNLRKILEEVVNEIGGETSGHEFAAGCIISRENEEKFIEVLKKNLEIEMVKIE